jgi:hypothetical protein
MSERSIFFQEYDTNGADYKINDIEFECKITLRNDGWTGNGYRKTGWHLLIMISINENGRIISCYAGLINIDVCKSEWTEKTTQSNFSNLKLLKEDIKYLTNIIGDVKINPINLKPQEVAVE